MPEAADKTPEAASAIALRMRTVGALQAAKHRLEGLKAVVGLDGFVDEIARLVDKRESFNQYSPILDLKTLSERIGLAAGKSTNLEMVVQKMKIGGNGPIMSNALAALGLHVSYIGALGFPIIHPVFQNFATHAEVISIANPGHTDALEFDDGKLLLGKLESLNEIDWARLTERAGFEKLLQLFNDAHLIGLVNWTMLPYMSEIWHRLLKEICPRLAPASPRRQIFFDLADPEKRLAQEIHEALELIGQFQPYFEVILGTNEKEGYEIAEVLNIAEEKHTPVSIQNMAAQIRERLHVGAVVIHPRAYAAAARAGESACVEGPFDPKPLISTGAGDHFNAGFCLGSLLNLPLDSCLLAGVTTSGFYVRTGTSPGVDELITFMNDWPV